MQEAISKTCDNIKAMLIEKNKAYGNSAIDPVRIFSKASPVEQILVRLDDKLSRLSRGHEYPGDDTIDDTIGYLILLKIAKAKEPTGSNDDAIVYGGCEGDCGATTLNEMTLANKSKAAKAIINPVVQ